LVKREKKKEFDVFQHELVPKHRVLPKKEVDEVLAKYHIRAYQLPYIKASDPAARALQALPGDVIEVVRRSPTAGEAIVYRYVIEG